MFIRLRDGTERELEEGELIPDGATLLRPLFMKDSTPSRPGDTSAEEAVEAAREGMRSFISNAWKRPDQRPAEEQNPCCTAEEAREHMAERIGSAWRNAR